MKLSKLAATVTGTALAALALTTVRPAQAAAPANPVQFTMVANHVAPPAAAAAQIRFVPLPDLPSAPPAVAQALPDPALAGLIILGAGAISARSRRRG